MDPTLATAGWVAVRLGALLAAHGAWIRLLGPLWFPVGGALALCFGASVALNGAVDVGAVSATQWLWGALREALSGGLLGLVVALPGYALLGAAATSANTLGGARLAALEVLIVAVVLALLFEAGGHRPLLGGLSAAARAWPAGEAALSRSLTTSELAGWAAGLLGLALALATPVLLVSAVLDLALRLVERPGSEPVAALRPWVVAAAASLALAASWEGYAAAWLRALAAPVQ
jgi:flagellar biosynthesis protein FliR